MPFKSDKQQRWMYANEPKIAREWSDRYGARNGGGIMDWADQGGMKNYLGEQQMVSAPKQWRSGPDSPSTELAYITQPEKDMIMKENIHGSLAGGPNEGPSGIISLDSQGDYTRDRSPGAYSSGPAGSGGGNTQQDLRNRAMNEKHMKEILTGQKDIGQTTKTGPRTRQYSDLPEWMEVKQPDGTYKTKHMASAYKDAGGGWLSNLFSRGAPGYRGIKGLSAWGDPMKNYSLRDGPKGKAYYTDKENFGEMRDAFPAFGLMGILKAMANKFKKPPRDMSEFNKLSLTKPEDQKAYIPEGSDVPMARVDRWTNPIEDDLMNYDEHSTMGNMDAPGPWNNFNQPTSNLDKLFANPGGTTNSNFANPGGRDLPYDSGYNMDDAMLESNYEDIRGSGGDDITFSEYMENINRHQPNTGIGTVNNDFPLKGTIEGWNEYKQPEEWQTQDFPVREDFYPGDRNKWSSYETGKGLDWGEFIDNMRL